MKALYKGFTAGIVLTLATVGIASADFTKNSDRVISVDRSIVDYSVGVPATANSGGSNAFTNTSSANGSFYKNRARTRAAELLLGVEDVKNYLSVSG